MLGNNANIISFMISLAPDLINKHGSFVKINEQVNYLGVIRQNLYLCGQKWQTEEGCQAWLNLQENLSENSSKSSFNEVGSIMLQHFIYAGYLNDVLQKMYTLRFLVSEWNDQTVSPDETDRKRRDWLLEDLYFVRFRYYKLDNIDWQTELLPEIRRDAYNDIKSFVLASSYETRRGQALQYDLQGERYSPLLLNLWQSLIQTIQQRWQYFTPDPTVVDLLNRFNIGDFVGSSPLKTAQLFLDCFCSVLYVGANYRRSMEEVQKLLAKELSKQAYSKDYIELILEALKQVVEDYLPRDVEDKQKRRLFFLKKIIYNSKNTKIFNYKELVTPTDVVDLQPLEDIIIKYFDDFWGQVEQNQVFADLVNERFNLLKELDSPTLESYDRQVLNQNNEDTSYLLDILSDKNKIGSISYEECSPLELDFEIQNNLEYLTKYTCHISAYFLNRLLYQVSRLAEHKQKEYLTFLALFRLHGILPYFTQATPTGIGLDEQVPEDKLSPLQLATRLQQSYQLFSKLICVAAPADIVSENGLTLPARPDFPVPPDLNHLFDWDNLVAVVIEKDLAKILGFNPNLTRMVNLFFKEANQEANFSFLADFTDLSASQTFNKTEKEIYAEKHQDVVRQIILLGEIFCQNLDYLQATFQGEARKSISLQHWYNLEKNRPNNNKWRFHFLSLINLAWGFLVVNHCGEQ
jgi:hypothetical protein